jgi:pyridoxal phosphate-dependent aminotransferase EpsN
VLAALGSSQLATLDSRVGRRRAVHDRYSSGLADLPGLTVADALRDTDREVDDAPSRWLTCIVLNPSESPVDRDGLIEGLEVRHIESRPVWKPMHLQPVYADAEAVGGAVAREAFNHGVALPSGSSLSDTDIDRVIDSIRELF